MMLSFSDEVLMTARALLGVVILVAASMGCGAFLVGVLPSLFSRTERLVFSWFGGFGILSLSLFLVGQIYFSFISIIAIVVTSLVLLVFSIRTHPDVFRTEKMLSASPHIKRDCRPSRAIPILVISFVLTISFFASLVAPSGDWSSDAIAYHLLGPKVWLRDTLIRAVPDNCHTAFPAIAEVMFAVLMAMGGLLAPNLSAVWTLALFLVVVYFLACRLGLSPGNARWAVALVAAMPAVYGGSHTEFVDVLYATFLLAAIRLLLDADSLRVAGCAGLFCGFAMGTKYTGLLALPILLFATAYSFFVSSRGGVSTAVSPSRQPFRKLATAAICALIVAAPFYLRNWFVLGSPIYPPTPQLAKFFAVRYLSPQAIESFHQYILARGSGLGRGFTAFLLLPFHLTFHTANFHGAGGIGLTPLAFVPVALWTLRNNLYARALAIVVFLLTVVWFLTQQESRFLIPVYSMLAIFAVGGWEALRELPSRVTKSLCATVVVISLVYGCFMIAVGRSDDLHASVSPAYAAQRSHARAFYLDSFEYLNYEASVRKVLILDRSVAPYYSDKPYSKVIGHWGEQTVAGIHTPADALQHLAQLDVTHILDVESEVAGFQVPPTDPCCQLVFSSRHQRVYRVQ